MLQYNGIFGTEDSFHPDITKMTQYLGWWDINHPESIPDIANFWGPYTATQLAAVPQGKRVVFLRGVLRNESYPQYVDPVAMFEQGGFPTSRAIAMLRPFGQALRAQGVRLDAVWTDNEGGANFWNLTHAQMQAVLSSPRARAKMPPTVRALHIEYFDWSHPNCRKSIVTFNNWALLLMWRALKQVMFSSGVFRGLATSGGSTATPPILNFQVWAPTFPCFDFNGWPYPAMTLDGRSHSPALYLNNGGSRYTYQRNHDQRWNALVDQINYIRSAMRRPGAVMFPTIPWPSYVHPWLFEQMIAHAVRTGVNSTNGSGWIYWREPWLNANVQDPLMAQIFARHDQPFPAQRNLPQIALDVDTITTAGYTTRYTDFLNNVPALP